MYETYSSVETEKSLLSRAFGWMFAGLAITAIVAIGLPFLLVNLSIPVDVYMTMVLVASVAQIVFMLWINFSVLRHGAAGRNLKLPFFLYAGTMGVLISSIVLTAGYAIIGQALGLTALAFGSMALYGRYTKSNLTGMGMLAVGALVGSLVLMLFNLFMRSSQLNWVISFVTFGAVMLITAFDVWRIQRISENGGNGTNLAIFFAFQLYVDFIYIFLRIVQFLAYSRR